MQTGTSDVKSKGEVVGQATFYIFDSLEEAAQKLGEKECVDLINAQVKTNEQNAIRAEKTGKPSKARIKELAVFRITPEDLASCGGDQRAIEALIAAKEVEVREEFGIEE